MKLGTIDELPADYLKALKELDMQPLWPMMRNVLPHGTPKVTTTPNHWPYKLVRPLLIRAGELTPVEKAERRVLVLCDPAAGSDALRVTPSIYIGLQLLLPRETAPSHRHTPSAVRIMVEGEGAYTVVEGEKCKMSKGDLVLTPGGLWHDHGHTGDKPVIWLDALDLPLFVYLEASYAEEGIFRPPSKEIDASYTHYRVAGLLPEGGQSQDNHPYPLIRFPFERTREALDALDRDNDIHRALELDFVNPRTGGSCLPTLGFTAMKLRVGSNNIPLIRSCAGVFHVVSGQGISKINGKKFSWRDSDTFSAPPYAKIEHLSVSEDAYLIRIHDRPLQEKMGFYEERESLLVEGNGDG